MVQSPFNGQVCSRRTAAAQLDANSINKPVPDFANVLGFFLLFVVVVCRPTILYHHARLSYDWTVAVCRSSVYLMLNKRKEHSLNSHYATYEPHTNRNGIFFLFFSRLKMWHLLQQITCLLTHRLQCQTCENITPSWIGNLLHCGWINRAAYCFASGHERLTGFLFSRLTHHLISFSVPTHSIIHSSTSVILILLHSYHFSLSPPPSIK